MNQKIIFPILGLFILFAGLTGFWAYKSQVFTESDVPVLPQEKIDLALDDKNMPTLEVGQEPSTPMWFTPEGADYMRTYLLEPSEKLNDFVDQDMMSRCASGANYQITSDVSPENPYFLGKVTLNKGCDLEEKFFDFRVSEDGLTLEISDPEKNNYIPYKEWFMAAKPIF